MADSFWQKMKYEDLISCNSYNYKIPFPPFPLRKIYIGYYNIFFIDIILIKDVKAGTAKVRECYVYKVTNLQ